MRPFRGSIVCGALALAAALLSPTPARADINLYEKDGWGFRTTGLIAAHYQLVLGGACEVGTDPMTPNANCGGDPPTTGGRVLVGGKIFPTGAQDTTDNSLTLSRVRSGFIG